MFGGDSSNDSVDSNGNGGSGNGGRPGGGGLLTNVGLAAIPIAIVVALILVMLNTQKSNQECYLTLEKLTPYCAVHWAVVVAVCAILGGIALFAFCILFNWNCSRARGRGS